MAPADPRNLGAQANLWSDSAATIPEEQIATGLLPYLALIAQKTWGSPPLAASYPLVERTAAVAAPASTAPACT